MFFCNAWFEMFFSEMEQQNRVKRVSHDILKLQREKKENNNDDKALLGLTGEYYVHNESELRKDVFLPLEFFFYLSSKFYFCCKIPPFTCFLHRYHIIDSNW